MVTRPEQRATAEVAPQPVELVEVAAGQAVAVRRDEGAPQAAGQVKPVAATLAPRPAVRAVAAPWAEAGKAVPEPPRPAAARAAGKTRVRVEAATGRRPAIPIRACMAAAWRLREA